MKGDLIKMGFAISSVAIPNEKFNVVSIVLKILIHK
jgi:hypothetical protein